MADDKKRLDIAKEIKEQIKETLEFEKEYGSILTKVLGFSKGVLAAEQEVLANKSLKRSVTNQEGKEVLKNLKSTNAIKEAVKAQIPLLGTIKTIKKAINVIAAANPYLAIVAVLGLAAAAFVTIRKEVLKTRNELGITKTEATFLEGQIRLAGLGVKLLGKNTEDARSAARGLVDAFGSLEQINSRTLYNTVELASKTGLTEQESAKLAKTFSILSGESLDTSLNSLLAKDALVDATGAVSSKVFKDVVQNTEAFARAGLKGSDNLLLAAASAAKLGTNLQAVESIASSLVDFQSSIQKEIEAELLLQKDLNLERARELALTGSREELIAEIQRQAGGAQAFAELDRIQQDALAGVFGLSIAELTPFLDEGNKQQVEQAKVAENTVDGINNLNKEVAEGQKQMIANQQTQISELQSINRRLVDLSRD